MLLERGGRMLSLHGFRDLASYGNADTRAASVYLLGCAPDCEVGEIIQRAVVDFSPIVREQAAFAILNLARNGVEVPGVIKMLEADENREVGAAAQVVKEELERSRGCGVIGRAVRAKGFRERYRENVLLLLE
jgi:hypothetical protein